MPKVDLIATRDFTYNTRRLRANDDFLARNCDDAKILVEVLGKARYGRPKATVAPPPPAVAQQMTAPTVEEVLTAEVVEAPKAKPQLDHDGNGKAGGSKKGSTRRRKAKAKK
jgi:hypothetical protein